MAKVGFRTSLFGFHKEEVIDYLNQAAQEYAVKEQELMRQCTALEDRLKEQEQQAAMEAVKMAELQETVDYFRAKEEEIEKTSVRIGTMYLVAKQNADEMVAAAERYAAEVGEYAKRQMLAAEQAGEKLEQLKTGAVESAHQFATDLSVLSNALTESRERLAAEMAALESADKDILLTDGTEAE